MPEPKPDPAAALEALRRLADRFLDEARAALGRPVHGVSLDLGGGVTMSFPFVPRRDS
jgi:hypothetical protein